MKNSPIVKWRVSIPWLLVETTYTTGTAKVDGSSQSTVAEEVRNQLRKRTIKRQVIASVKQAIGVNGPTRHKETYF
ncbi:hypothetical protein J6590_030280 [Homalodisca vitripennis]|nr:hypothetical protein J6590_030280 [Homalodisca vitripennis]